MTCTPTPRYDLYWPHLVVMLLCNEAGASADGPLHLPCVINCPVPNRLRLCHSLQQLVMSLCMCVRSPCNVRNEAGASADGQLHLPRVEEVRSMLSPFVLRRLKSAVLGQLVPKQTQLDLLPLVSARCTLTERCSAHCRLNVLQCVHLNHSKPLQPE